MKKTRIVSAFPACGKTYLFENGYEDSVIIDSDSSEFSWLDLGGEIPRHRHPDFPNNYMDHIKGKIGEVDYIFVSSHIEIKKALDESGLCWILVSPNKKLMLEWVGRCYMRENSDAFIKTMIDNWDNWTNPYDQLNPVGRCILESGEYLESKMGFIETFNYN